MEATNSHIAQLRPGIRRAARGQRWPMREPLAGFLLLIRHALVVEAHFVGMVCFEDIFQRRGRLLRAIPGAALPMIAADRYSL